MKATWWEKCLLAVMVIGINLFAYATQAHAMAEGGTYGDMFWNLVVKRILQLP